MLVVKNIKTIGAIVGVISLVIVVLFGSWKLGDRFLSEQDAANKAKIAACQQKGQAHVVMIKNDKANPQHTDGKLCDTLTITNEDNTVRLMAFGQHDEHQPYDGVGERELSKGQSVTVTMSKAGTYEFHDHIGDIVKGSFTVAK